MARTINKGEMPLGGDTGTTVSGNVTYVYNNTVVTQTSSFWCDTIDELQAVIVSGYSGGEDYGVFYPEGTTASRKNFIYEYDKTSVATPTTVADHYSFIKPNEITLPAAGRWEKKTELSFVSTGDFGAEENLYSTTSNGTVPRTGTSTNYAVLTALTSTTSRWIEPASVTEITAAINFCITNNTLSE